MRKYSTVDYSTGEGGASDSSIAVTVMIIFYTSEHLSFPCSTILCYTMTCYTILKILYYAMKYYTYLGYTML